MTVSMDQQIATKMEALQPQHLEVINESHMHAGPAMDSHYKIILISEVFAGKRPVARHQIVYQQLTDEMAGPVHAVALHLYTPEEWQQSGAAPGSPNCRGGSKGQ